MQETEILGHGEGRGDLPRRVGPDRGELEGGRQVFAAVIFRLRHLPAALDRAPDELEIRVGRQSFCRDPHRCPGRAMLGRNRHMPDKPVQRGKRRLTADLRGCAGGASRAMAKRQRAATPRLPIIGSLLGRFESAGDYCQQ